ncbi:MAG: hypothetical protein V3U56_13005 [Syntrophobacteria bacterium]
MDGRKILPAIVCILAFFQLICFAGQGWGQSFSHLNLDPDQVLWSRLSFRAKRAVVDVKVDVRLAPFSTAEFELVWRTNPQSIRLPSLGQEVYNINVNRVIDHIFSPPVTLSNQVLFEPNQAAALYRVRLRRGKDDIKRTYWFSREGVHRLRTKPSTKREASRDPAKWTDAKTSFYRYDLTQLGCPHVTDPMLLIYLLSAAQIDKSGESLSLCVFGKQQLHHVRMRVEKLHTLEVDYSENRGEGKVRKKGKVDGLRITLEAQPLQSDLKNAENFSFLGFHKDITIDIDPELRIPLQISGRIPTVGAVALKLSGVRMKGSSQPNKMP